MFDLPCRSTLEIFPDELLLEICRYLHSGDVLYAFFGLNSRLNRMITFYHRHVSLHRTFYLQFLEIFRGILPRISSSIRSLVIYELESPLFYQLFASDHFYPNLEKLTLVNWTDEKLLVFLDTLHQMKSLEQLLIQALDVTTSVKNIDLLRKILACNDHRLRQVRFDHECDALSLTDDPTCFSLSSPPPPIFPNIIQLDIELRTTTDLYQLMDIVPNLEQLRITFKHSWIKISSSEQRFARLKDFSVYAMSWFSNFEDLKTLIQISSTMETLSLVLVTHDYFMVDRQRICSILPCSIQQFHYSICYQPSDVHERFVPEEILQMWKSIPIAYSICEHDRRIFLHTIAYQSNRLSLRALFNQKMSSNNDQLIYGKVRHLHVYDTTNLTDTFGIIRQCRQILDLIISIRTLPSKTPLDTRKQQFLLPHLHRLDFLSIQGNLPDSHQIEQILSVSPNLSAISIDFDCLHKLLIDDNQPLSLYYLLHQRIVILCLRFEDTTIEQLTHEHIHSIARIFSRVNHMCIDLRNSNLCIQSVSIATVLNSFPKLMVLSMYGKLAEEIDVNKTGLADYLIEHSQRKLFDRQQFHVDYGNERLKVWM